MTSAKGALSFGGLQTQPRAFDDVSSVQGTDVYLPSNDGYAAAHVHDAADLLDAVTAGAVVPPVVGSAAGKVIASDDSTAGRTTDKHAAVGKTGVRRLRPVEQLTGVSRDRPEIVMITKFQPAFQDASMLPRVVSAGSSRANPVGQFISGQIAARKIRRAVATRVVSSAAKKSKPVRDDLATRGAAVQTELRALGNASAFMLNVVRSSLLFKAGLDLREGTHVVDPQQEFAQHAGTVQTSFHRGAIDITSKKKSHAASTGGATKHDVIDVMVRLGYDRQTALTTFTSTKLWMQLISDLRDILRYHSLEIVDASTTARVKDRSPTALTRIDTTYFGIRPGITDVPSLRDIRISSRGDLLTFASNVDAAYQFMYDGPHLKSEEMRLTMLVHLIAKELRYSRGLSNEQVRRTLADSYKYAGTLDGGNAGLFDAILGVPGTTITHTSPGNVSTFMGLAQHQVANDQVVLTFEPDYIDLPEGTYTPGSAYYADGVLDLDKGKFDTSRLVELQKRFTVALSGFINVDVGLDLGGSGYSLDNTYVSNDKVTTIVSDPAALFDYVVNRFVDVKTGHSQYDVSNDPLAVVYAEARTDTRLRALLFLLSLARIGRASSEGPNPWDVIGQALVSVPSSDPTNPADVLHNVKTYGHSAANELADAVRDRILNKLLKAHGIIPSAKASGDGVLQLTTDGMRDALIKGTKLTAVIDDALLNILNTFVNGDRAMVQPTISFDTNFAISLGLGGLGQLPAFAAAANAPKPPARTRYGGHVDTVMAMVIFDLICTSISRYADMKIAGLSVATAGSSAGQQCFVINRAPTSHAKSVAEVEARLAKESSLIQQISSVLTKTTADIAVSAGKLADYLSAPDSIKQLTKITTVVGTGIELKALFTEQQIMLVAAAVDDMLELAQRSNEDADASGTTDADEEIRFLDDADASVGTRAVLSSALATVELTPARGANKRIIVVGVPVGLGEHLRRRIDLSTAKTGAFAVRQSDIIRVMVHKVDIQTPDLVFFPRPYFFELSRFTIKNSTRYRRLPVDCSLDDVVVAIPTRDYGSTIGTRVSYADPRDLPGSRMPVDGLSASDVLAFNDAEHAFMTSDVKRELLRNHVISHLMESYVRILTGIDLSEYHFDLEQPAPSITGTTLGRIIDARVSHISDTFTARSADVGVQSGAGLFSHLMTPEMPAAQPRVTTQQGPGRAAVRDMRPDAQRVVQHDARTVSGLSRENTTVSDPLVLSRRLLMPKQFDRVFHLLVDPDDFEIDVTRTSSTAYGQQALAALQASGDVITVRQSSAEASLRSSITSQERLRLRPRDHGAGDIAFEKYIVSIEPAYGGVQG